jgi:hypothetical protein
MPSRMRCAGGSRAREAWRAGQALQSFVIPLLRALRLCFRAALCAALAHDEFRRQHFRIKDAPVPLVGLSDLGQLRIAKTLWPFLIRSTDLSSGCVALGVALLGQNGVDSHG